MALLSSALEAIGDTPLVALDRLHAGPGRVFAKLESVNPGGSVKDRAAKAIVQAAYRAGKLRKGQPVVEMTSGNMGAGLAVVCAITGNPFVAVMSEGNSPERAKMMRALGAEVVLVPQAEGRPGEVTGKDIEAAASRAREMAEERGAFYVDQFRNPAGVAAHEETTGPEIWRDMGGKMDAFVAIVGSGGTFVGASRFLKRTDPGVRCYVVEPAGAQILAGERVTKTRHVLQGAGYAVVPPLWDASLADGFVAVTDDEARTYRRLLAEREGLYVGYSAAANVCASVRALHAFGLGPEARVATILSDTGLKY